MIIFCHVGAGSQEFELSSSSFPQAFAGGELDMGMAEHNLGFTRDSKLISRGLLCYFTYPFLGLLLTQVTAKKRTEPDRSQELGTTSRSHTCKSRIYSGRLPATAYPAAPAGKVEQQGLVRWHNG